MPNRIFKDGMSYLLLKADARHIPLGDAAVAKLCEVGT